LRNLYIYLLLFICNIQSLFFIKSNQSFKGKKLVIYRPENAALKAGGNLKKTILTVYFLLAF
jgi:hypothetical protein